MNKYYADVDRLRKEIEGVSNVFGRNIIGIIGKKEVNSMIMAYGDKLRT